MGLTLQPEEVQRVKWATKEEILMKIDQEIFIPYHKSLVELIVDMRKHMGSHRKPWAMVPRFFKALVDWGTGAVSHYNVSTGIISEMSGEFIEKKQYKSVTPFCSLQF